VPRWNVETTIIVPGAFTSGTNDFAHAGSPEDKARLKGLVSPAKNPVFSKLFIPDGI
jgi:hypothetical protein